MLIWGGESYVKYIIPANKFNLPGIQGWAVSFCPSKGLDHPKDPEWSMLFNTIPRVEPYLSLHTLGNYLGVQALHGYLQLVP